MFVKNIESKKNINLKKSLISNNMFSYKISMSHFLYYTPGSTSPDVATWVDVALSHRLSSAEDEKMRLSQVV